MPEDAGKNVFLVMPAKAVSAGETGVKDKI